MARDPPTPLAASSSELRDLSLVPTTVRPARVAIAHPQLRDLILPLERGRVLYPRGAGVDEMSWKVDGEDESSGDEGASGAKIVKQAEATIRTFAKLFFTPNCLTASRGIFACGGQHGELYITELNLPSSSSSRSAYEKRFQGSATRVKPFGLSLSLPTRSINNSMLILPSWPEEWAAIRRQRKVGFVGQQQDEEDELDEDEEDGFGEGGEDGAEATSDDEAMDIDSEDDMAEADPSSPASSVATYPNTVPFLHPPRIPHLPSPPPVRSSFDIPTISSSSAGSRRAASFSTAARPTFSPHPPAQLVTSRPRPGSFSHASAFPPRPSSRASSSRRPSRHKMQKHREEPRLLISNNDQTVKMFSIRSSAGVAKPEDDLRTRTAQAARDGRSSRLSERMGLNAPTLPPPRFGSRFGWDSLGVNEGISSALGMDMQDGEEAERRRQREAFERIVGVRVSPISGQREEVRSPPGDGNERLSRGGEERRLAKVGGTRFKYAINHSSLSPDLRTMVSVGDSSDVYLFEVIDGGKEFRRIGTYNAATESGFSTAWSKDGRKFAVASQDGQVTVWDHRSSRPFSIFHTSPSSSSAPSSRAHTPTTPSFASDLSFSRHHSPRQERRPYHAMLVDPVTGDQRSELSLTGREPARVVKFSPEGSDRDLMVFTEQFSNIHIVDARTFHTHVVVPVPPTPPPSATRSSAVTPSLEAAAASTQRPRRDRDRDRPGWENGTWGIAGVAFDPTGNWLYSGTEQSVVEWDVRRCGGGGDGGSWGFV